MSEVRDGVRQLLTLPRQLQPEALERLLDRLGPPPAEQWNTAFGPDSLFDAWTRTTLTRGLYAANALAIRPRLAKPFRALEIGGGDGRLWRSVLSSADEGTLWLIDPAEAVHEEVARRLPPGVELISNRAPVQEAELPEDVDVAVCSLTLHHVPGEEKREVLRRLRASVTGLFVLNEADVHCEVDLAPGDPVLVDNLFDSYVRRCGRALLDEAPDERVDAILHLWCLAQVRLAYVPIDERDVYELDVCRWLELLASTGFKVQSRRCTDPYGLFWQYLSA